MASDTLPETDADRPETPADAANRELGEPTFAVEPAARAGLPGPVYDTLKALSSLKITVALFALGIFIVLAGTVAQTKMGNWEAVDRYFRTFVAFVEFDIFAPKSFFPDRTEKPLAIPLGGNRELTGFFFPGGWLIGACMLVNLLAAHALRFKVQAKGPRLTAGLAVTAVGALLVWLVVASGDNAEGLQDQLSKRLLEGLWYTFVAAIAAGVGGAVWGCLKLDRGSRPLEWWTSAFFGTLLAALLVYILANGEDAMLRPESMRILWQLVKASTASAVLLAGCIMVFKKRGGIVMLHAGIGLLMFSELLVGMYAEEGQMTINEGETSNYAQDIREVELAFVDRSGKDELQVVVPESRLKDDEPVRVGELPLTVVPLEFHDNSNLRNLGDEERRPFDPDDDDPRSTQSKIFSLLAERKRTEDPAERDRIDREIADLDERLIRELRQTETRIEKLTADREKAGEKAEKTRLDERIADLEARLLRYAALSHTVEAAPPTNGLESKVDVASLWVEIRDAEGKTLGKWLFNQHLNEQRVHVDGKTYFASLRFKRKYLPYSVHLIDARRRNYVGTGTAKDYSSFVKMVDSETGFERDDIRIWMNNPLRYRGQTLYQSDLRPVPVVDPETGRPEFEMVDGVRKPKMVDQTVLSVVTNNGWMLPYVCCMIVAFGMAHQFGVSLLRFLGRKRRQSLETPVPVTWGDYVPTAALVLLAAAFVAGMARPASTDPDEMAVHAFGTLPVTSQGRVKPMDSLARNELVSITEREGFKKFETDEEKGKVFNDVRVSKTTTPAIVWLLDTITKAEQANQYPVFRIVNLELIEDLRLQPRPGFFRYSFDEVWPKRDLLIERVRPAMEKKDDERNLDERKAIELYRALQSYVNVQLAFVDAGSAANGGQSETEYVRQILRLGESLDEIPLATPGVGEEAAWHSYSRGAARMWMRGYAREHGLGTVEDVTRRIAEDSRDDLDYRLLYDDVLEELVEHDLVDSIARLALSEQPEMSPQLARQRAAMLLKEELPPNVAEQFEQVRANARRALERTPARVHATTQRVIADQLRDQIPKVLGDFDLAGDDPPEIVALHDVFAAYREGDVPGFAEAIETYRDVLGSEPRREYDATRVAFEAWFNGLAPFWVGQWLSIVVFVVAVASWLGWTRPLSWGAFWLMAFTLVLATLALAGRVYISGRPPVTNLYSSAVFIAWGGMVVGLAMEAVYRTGIGTAVAGAMGFLSLGIAHFLSREGDTIAVMVAVLDTNIWLATHVVCVTMGYATTFIAGFFGLWYVFAGLCTSSLDRDRERSLVKMIYGSLCFALFFSFVGTVLGGLWADDSWGRFWGWDPKENGALIIVLWNALVLHARWDGLVKDRGLAVLAVAGNITTSWSWFGTNELRAGLHSYGFTEGVLATLGLAVGLHLVVIAVAACIPKSMWVSFAVHRPDNGDV